jgi:hypothetical protein
MQTRYVVLCFILFLCGCGSGTPEGILPEKVMVGLLIDMQIADARVSGAGQRSDTARVMMRFYEDTIFEKHNVNREVYLKSMAYYMDHPKLMDKMYEAMIDTLHLREQKIQRKKEEELKAEEEEMQENAEALEVM